MHLSSAERSGWQSRRVRRLSTPAWIYGGVVCIAATAAAVAATAEPGPLRHDWVAFAALAPLAAAAPFFRVAVGRNHGFHAGPAFVVAGALVLPPALVVALVLALHLPQWARRRARWYILAFNVSESTLTALGAWVAVDLVGRGEGGRFALSGLAATLAFVLVNHVLLAAMLRLARGHTLQQTGLFSAVGLGGELVLAGLGVALGAFAQFNPWLLPALVAPLLLAHRSFSTTAKLRESEERFRTMFESAPTAMVLLALDGTVVAANRSLELLLGYEAVELVGRTTAGLRHPDDSEEIGALFGALVRGELDVFRRDARYVRKDGETVYVHVAAALVRDADAKPDYVISMAVDVTERTQLEEQLARSQKLEAIGRLAGGVAHDFNNMLTAIGGYTALALEHAGEVESVRADLAELRKTTERAARMTRQLLAFSRRQVLQPEPLDVNEVVRDLESMLRPMLGEGVSLRTVLEPELGAVEADPVQLQQVVLNLVLNARDAMPAGGPISLETANVDRVEPADTIPAGRYVTLTVRDEGEGIDERTLGQIFDPFFTTKEPGKGTGLGLATVYGIVKQSGGYVEVESEVGKGSSFTIYLPRASAGRPESGPEEPAAPDATRTVQRASILLVEDEETVRELVRQVLEAADYDVVAAAGGAEALARGEEREFDLLLTDLTMAGMGGRELAERLRERHPTLKLLFMSGLADGGLSADGNLPAGAAFLEKPFAFATLLETVGAALGR